LWRSTAATALHPQAAKLLHQRLTSPICLSCAVQLQVHQQKIIGKKIEHFLILERKSFLGIKAELK
jgi:hypothetical protein